MGQAFAQESGGRKGASSKTWLGHWKPEYEEMNMNELMLQARLPSYKPALSHLVNNLCSQWCTQKFQVFQCP